MKRPPLHLTSSAGPWTWVPVYGPHLTVLYPAVPDGTRSWRFLLPFRAKPGHFAAMPAAGSEDE